MTRPDFIETYTGRRFRPLAPIASDIDVRDIAHALSHQCRFSGHTRVPYSVGEHSVRVARLLKAQGYGPVSQLWGLLHDASEAYLVDIPSPLKGLPAFAEYRAAEETLMRCVCVQFRLPLIQPREVHQADAILLATEARDLMPYRPEHWAGLDARALPDTIIPWSPTTVKGVFLDLFCDLSGSRT